MVIVQFTKKFPFPLHDGESWAVRGSAEGLHKLGHQVHLISLDTDKHPSSPFTVEKLNNQNWYQSISLLPINTSPTNLGALSNIFSNRSFHIDRYSSSVVEKHFVNKIKGIENVDVVLFESLFVLPYLEAVKLHLPSALTVYRAHNVEHKVWGRLANEVSPLAKTYFKIQASRIQRYERQIIRKVDLIATVSAKDAEELSTSSSVTSNIPISYPIPLETLESNSWYKTRLGFLGSLDWRPNRNGILRFYQDIWHSLDHDLYELHIAGRMSNELSMDETVVIHGEVESSADFLGHVDISIVPLWSGSGTRVKIIESMAHQVPVISTPIGAEGLDAKHGREIFIVESPEEWKKVLSDIYRGNINLIEVKENALNYINENHNILKNAELLLDEVNKRKKQNEA